MNRATRRNDDHRRSSCSPLAIQATSIPAEGGSEQARAVALWRGEELHFEGPVTWLAADQPEEIPELLDRVDQEVARGCSAVGFLAFEAAAAFDPALAFLSRDSELPYCGFGLFESVRRITAQRLPEQFLLKLEPSLEQAAHRRAIAAIHDSIARGDVYQVNYTFPFSLEFPPGAGASGDETGLALLGRLIEGQGGGFGGYLNHPRVEICSGSPELFFELQGDRIVTRPMKGTAPRGRYHDEDHALARQLHHSPKDRAENLMIVDMMRNDLGRIARPGTVVAERLFEVERLPTVHQMTSTISALTDVSLREIFGALFPCASITGAPKVAAVRSLHALERGPRGVYTGCFGVVLPRAPQSLPPPTGSPADVEGGSAVELRTAVASNRGKRDQRYARFNVAIRTAWRTPLESAYHYGVGSGVVWDSRAEPEYRECLMKARGLRAPPPAFRLIETMLVLPPGRNAGQDSLCRIRRLHRHLDRLRQSADYFDFRYPLDEIVSSLTQALEREAPRDSELPLVRTAGAVRTRRLRLRLLLDRAGTVTVELRPHAGPPALAQVILASSPVALDDPFVCHKTTRRETYQEALVEARDRAQRRCLEIDDVILWNDRGEITESTIANILLPPLAGSRRWRTPHRSSGLLAGTLRQDLLDRGRIEEAALSISDLHSSPTGILINSVRGFVPFTLID